MDDGIGVVVWVVVAVVVGAMICSICVSFSFFVIEASDENSKCYKRLLAPTNPWKRCICQMFYSITIDELLR